GVNQLHEWSHSAKDLSDTPKKLQILAENYILILESKLHF
ncbi:hypothetical protein NEIELOOT_03171, partial [Neisseria elongata subsp. glycolytica ATCC 29315]